MDFNKIKELGIEYAEKGKSVAIELAEKGKAQAQIVTEQAKLAKAERQLGALVYSLAKGKEENQPLVDKYIDMIGSIEQKIEQLKATLTPAEKEEVERVEQTMEQAMDAEAAPAGEAPAEPAAPEAEAKTCPQCGAEVADDALFCGKCGAQL